MGVLSWSYCISVANSVCWYHQLGSMYTVKWTVYTSKTKVDWFVYDRCWSQVRFRIPLNPIHQSRSLAHGYIHRNAIYQTLAFSDRGICADSLISISKISLRSYTALLGILPTWLYFDPDQSHWIYQHDTSIVPTTIQYRYNLVQTIQNLLQGYPFSGELLTDPAFDHQWGVESMQGSGHRTIRVRTPCSLTQSCDMKSSIYVT